jgi:2-dehydropantoate 2-reductase
MRFIVLGAGAIGGVVGGRLFEHGHDVVLVARGEHYQEISKYGLRLQSPDRTVTLAIPVVAHPREISYRDDDVVLIAVKSQDTSAAIRALASVAPNTLPVVCAQNGVENERVALRHFTNVYGMCVMCPATHLVPGAVQAHSTPITGLLDLGRWPTGIDDRATTIASIFGASSFSSGAFEDIARWKWGKLIVNLGNAVEAVCGTAARGGEISQRAQQEGAACLDAAGIAYVGDEENATRRGSLLTQLPVDGVARGGGSTWQSLARSSGTVETDYLNGEIVLLGRLFGVPTPVNQLLQRLAGELASDRRTPGSIFEDEFYDLLA